MNEYKETTKLKKRDYPSPFHYDPRMAIEAIVQKEENLIETVTEVLGNAGKPKDERCEVILSRSK